MSAVDTMARPTRRQPFDARPLLSALAMHGGVIALFLWVGHAADHPIPPPLEMTVILDTPPTPTPAAPTAPDSSASSPPEPTTPADAPPDAPPPDPTPPGATIAPTATDPPPPALAPMIPVPPVATEAAPPTVMNLSSAPRSDAPSDVMPSEVIPASPTPSAETALPALPSPSPVAVPPEVKPDPHQSETRHVARPPQHAAPRTLPRSQPDPDQTPPAAPQVAQATAAASAAATTATAAWRDALAAWLQAHKSYPEAARARHQEGIVSLRFVVARDGHVIDVAVAHGSGVDVLDGAAFAMLRNAHVPPLPGAMPQSELSVTMALHYTLER